MKQIVVKLIAECSRILLGLTFIFSGTVKAIDPAGSAIKIEEYFVAFGMGAFQWLGIVFAFALIAIEFALGVMMLMAVYRRLTAVSVLLFMAVMTPVTLYLALFNPVADCGCFGDAFVISNWETFYKNVVLSAASIAVTVWHKKLTPCYTFKAYWFVALFPLIYAVGFCYYNYNYLPIVDFRPYKIGANIPNLMAIPADAPQDEYTFIYRKDGVEKEFAIDQIPSDDSTWVYVDSKLIKQGYIPPVSSFELYDGELNNIADGLLADPKPLLLLIAPDLSQASDSHIDEINSIYDFAAEAGATFYGVTASSEEVIAEWKRMTGADYPFLTADDVLLKTIVRSNPGLVVLRQGTILAKWHHNEIPATDQLKKLLDAPAGTTEEKPSPTPFVLAFALPLSLVWIYDALSNRQLRRTKH